MRNTATVLVSLFLAVLVGCSSGGVETSVQPVPPSTPQITASIQKGIQARRNGDYRAALALLKPLANKGYPAAQYNLGIIYEQGKGVHKDFDAALKWFHRASARGYGDASFKIGRMYAWGRGVTRDYDEADKWYLRAANQGNVEGQLTVATVYGVYAIARRSRSEQYRIKAVKWFMIAKACGAKELDESNQTSKNFRFIKSKMTTAEVSKARHLAYKWLASHGKLVSQSSN